MKEKQSFEQTSLPKLIPLSKFNDFIPYPSVGALRQCYFYNTDNFKDKATRTISKRIYIDTEAFYKWVDECNQAKKGAVNG